jgi:uncharacterized membrane protein
MKEYKPRLIVALASSLLSLAAQGKDAVCYRLTQLSSGTEENFFVAGMNDKGEVVGGRDFRAFLWRDGQFADLPPPLDGELSGADGINDHSDIVGGYVDEQFQSHAVFLRRNGKVTEIPALPGGQTPALLDINNRREILGGSFSSASGFQHFIWQRGQVTLLERLPNDEIRLAATINDRGAAVGSGGQSGFGFAVLWERDGSVMQLSRPEGAPAALGIDINNRRQVLANGFFTITPPSAPPRRIQPYIWDEGETTVLGFPYPNYNNGGATAMNNRGLVVGQTFDSRSSFTSAVATLWRRGQPLDLNTLICADDPLQPHVRLRIAWEVNDRGEIVAQGTDARQPNIGPHYFLTPDPQSRGTAR